MDDKCRFLVADDCIFTVKLHVELLLARGHYCDYVLNGEEAMDKILTRYYDGVVTDNHMPGLKGVELAQKTRELFKLGELPIFIVTSDQKEEYAGALLGLHDVMVFAKPITSIQIDQIVAVTLKARGYRRFVEGPSLFTTP